MTKTVFKNKINLIRVLILFPEFFSNDLTSLINMTVEFNSRQKNADTQRNLIESVENLLKPKFPTVKAWLIGSYAYEITKAGLAPVDIYLDLRKLITSNNQTNYIFEVNIYWGFFFNFL